MSFPAGGPGTLTVSGAAYFLQAAAQVESPLPGGVATVFRFLFNVPQWIQIWGLVLGLALGGAGLFVVWRRRAGILTWLTSRSRAVTLALGTLAVLAIVGFAGAGAWSWQYSQHDNGFCTGCHIMGAPFRRFTLSQHSKLECHDCHQQSVFASMRQLYLWVAERPGDIGAHAKVPNGVCANCHITDQPEVWQRVASTAGHRTHLESDSSALRGLQCVTCHGVEVHQFAPVSQTCAQSGCHESVGIALSRMQDQTSLHCVACHPFTAQVPRLATRDSAAGTLRPGETQCLACHQMQEAIPRFDAARDPHSGSCGMCHNPHVQRVAADAAKTCASAECHAGWRDEPFHTGLRHRDVGTQCTLCHQPHAARVDASDCAGCHQRINQQRSNRRLPVPFDTGQALQRRAAAAPAPDEPWPRGKGDRPPRARLAAALAPAPQDTFSHQRHAKLACITCHPSDRQHGQLSFEPPRGCQICHHQVSPGATCATCHTRNELGSPRPVNVRVTVAGAPARSHPATFEHAEHEDVPCADCHIAPVTLQPDSGVARCASCHERHHADGQACTVCHDGEAASAAHRPASETHTGCDACHRPQTVGLLVPTRAFCLTCHTRQAQHYPESECTTCHFQSSPSAFRPHLSGGRS